MDRGDFESVHARVLPDGTRPHERRRDRRDVVPGVQHDRGAVPDDRADVRRRLRQRNGLGTRSRRRLHARRHRRRREARLGYSGGPAGGRLDRSRSCFDRRHHTPGLHGALPPEPGDDRAVRWRRADPHGQRPRAGVLGSQEHVPSVEGGAAHGARPVPRFAARHHSRTLARGGGGRRCEGAGQETARSRHRCGGDRASRRGTLGTRGGGEREPRRAGVSRGSESSALSVRFVHVVTAPPR